MPKRGRWAKDYSKSLIARDGYVIIAADLSQIELRIMAWMANDPTMLRIYQEDGDIHTMTAMQVAGIHSMEEWEALSDTERGDFRRSAKIVNFGFLYGLSAFGFKRYAKTEYNIDYTDREAVDMRNVFFNTYDRVEPYHEAVKGRAHLDGYVRALHGAVRHLPSIASPDPKMVAMAERQAINAPIQRAASDMGLIAMSRFGAQVDLAICRPNAFIHDAIYAECKEEHADEMMSALKWVTENPPLWGWFGLDAPLPIRSNVEVGVNMGEMVEREDIEAVKPDWWQDEEARLLWEKYGYRAPRKMLNVSTEKHS